MSLESKEEMGTEEWSGLMRSGINSRECEESGWENSINFPSSWF